MLLIMTLVLQCLTGIDYLNIIVVQNLVEYLTIPNLIKNLQPIALKWDTLAQYFGMSVLGLKKLDNYVQGSGLRHLT
jgi:hypothetical protein